MKKNLTAFTLSLLLVSLVLNSCSSIPYSTNRQDQAKVGKENFRTTASPSAEEEFKKVALDAAEYYNSFSDDRKNEIKIFIENMQKYMIEAMYKDDASKIKIYKEAQLYFNRVFQAVYGNIKNERRGINSFVPINKAPLWTLQEEIKILNQEALKYPEAYIDFDFITGIKILQLFTQKLTTKDKEEAKVMYGSSLSKLSDTKKNVFPKFEEIDELFHFQGSDEERILKLFSMTEKMLETPVHELRNLGNKLMASGQIKTDIPEMKLAISLINFYFNRLPNDVIKTILSELVSVGADATQEDLMKIIFQNTGPGIGKALQQFARANGVGPELEKLMAILESSGKEVPYHLARPILENDPGGFEFKSIAKHATGTGTVAQTNKATVLINGKEIVAAVRFPKPGIAQRVQEDIQILRDFVPENEALLKEQGIEDVAVIEKLISSVEKFLNEELDFNIATKRQIEAYKIYSNSIRISGHPKFRTINVIVPKVYLPPTGNTHIQVQDFVGGGEKFANLTDKRAQKIVAEEMIRLWFEEALFKSGYLHADLHQGNFRVALIEDSSKINLIIYDYGLSATLKPNEQKAFLLLGAGAKIKSPEIIADGILASMNSKDYYLREKLIKDIEKEMKNNIIKTPEKWIEWSVKKNYLVSDNLGAVARGAMMLQQLPLSIGKAEMLNEVIAKSAVQHLVRDIVDHNYDFPLSKMDMVKMASDGVKNTCKSIISSFF